ncbi:OmpP1/FadL family transporter [Cloacibacillus porcorum]|uniref:OmpP1/FadL family transporter n=1 Tax=Cloacibacillus porcorum TaxID=1197717 RepID=UPI00267207FB|nr:outer membrane protein transport protein [Cloacibacillus porcorum]
MIGVLMLTLLALSIPAAAFAEGFGVYEWSAAGTAMGDNYMFGENDPSVLAYNPAQITKLNGSYLSIGTAWVNPATSVTFNGLKSSVLNRNNSDEWDNSYSPALIPYMYYAQKAGKNSWWGVAFFARYGNQIEYDDLWPGRYDTVFTGVKGVTLQPTYAFKINDKLSAAVGLDINYVQLRMKKDVPAFAPGSITHLGDIRSDLDGDSTNIGWVASLMYDFTPKTSAAVVYRARVKHTMDADINFSGTLLGLGPQNVSTMAHGTVTLPDSLSLGLGHKFNDRTRMEINATWTNWSTYNALNLTFDDPILGNTKSDNPKDWSAAWRIGIGIEHKLSQKWSILGGYVYDESPVPDQYMDFTVPTGDRHRGSIGFKYRPNETSELAFAYTAIWAGNRDVQSHIGGADYASAYIHDGLTQVLSIGYTVKLK